MDKYRIEIEDTLFFMVDIQEKLVPAMEANRKVVNNSLILLKSAEELEIDAIATEQYPKGLGGSLEELKEYIDEESIFEKIEFTGCIYEVREYLRESGKENIVLFGMETHVCVYQTVRDLLDLEYNVFVVSDAVASRTRENKEVALDLLRDMGAKITSTETILFDLIKEAGTDRFKFISGLIK